MPTKPFAAYPGDKPYIFVSYAHADRDIVYSDLGWMHDAGFRVWYDEGINPTENWVGVIPRRIATCTVFMVFISPRAAESKWVRKELSLAERRSLPILPVYLADTKIDDELDFQIGGTQSLFRHELTEAEYRTKLDLQLRKYEGLIDPHGTTLELHRTVVADRAAAPPGYTLASWFQPGTTTGSEISESRLLPDGRWLVVVADVAGTGPTTAMLGTLLTGMLDVAIAGPGVALAEALGRVNAAYCRRSGDRYATLAAVLVDPKNHRLTAVNAGEMPPIVHRAEGKAWRFPEEHTGLPLGVVLDAPYSQVEESLHPGDTLLLVTDGVTDARNLDGEVIGLDGVDRIIDRVSGSPHRVVASLREALTSYASGRRFAEDVTVVCLGRESG